MAKRHLCWQKDEKRTATLTGQSVARSPRPGSAERRQRQAGVTHHRKSLRLRRRRPKAERRRGQGIPWPRHLYAHASAVPRSWKVAFQADGDQAFPGNGRLSAVEEELRRLRAENKRLLTEREVLKKA